MYTQDEIIKIGDKYYLNTDVQKVLEVRINPIAETEIGTVQ